MAVINLRPDQFALLGHRIHYAWAIVFITALMRLVSSSFRMSFPALVPIIAEVFGWSQGLILFAFSLQWVVSGMFGPPSGWLGDRYGARFTLTLGASLYIVSMILAGFMTELWHLYLFFGVMLSASMGIFQVPLTVSVTSWFRRHLGLGMGLLQSSQGVGPVIVPAIMLGLVAFFSLGQGQQWAEAFPIFGADSIGIRMAFWIPGIVGGIILLLLTKFFYNSPEDVGMRQLGADPNEPLRATPTTGRGAKERARYSCARCAKLPPLEPGWHPLLGMRRPCHHHHVSSGYGGGSIGPGGWVPRGGQSLGWGLGHRNQHRGHHAPDEHHNPVCRSYRSRSVW